MIIRPETVAKKISKIKRREPTKKQISRTRVRGIIYVLVAILLAVTLRIDFRFLNSPKLASQLENRNSHEVYTNAIEDFLSKNMIPGMVLGVVDKNGSHLFTYGYQCLSKNQKVTGDTIFEIGSISKVFTGLMLAEAVNSGSVSLEDSVSSFLNIETKNQDIYNKTTLKNLVTHTSGLPRVPKNLLFTADTILSSFFGSNPYRTLTEDRLLSNLNQAATQKSVGTDWEYSNYGFSLLGVILSSAQGLSYEEFLNSAVTEPLEMKSTTISLSQEQKERFASPYRGYLRLKSFNIGMQSAPWQFNDAVAGAGGILSTGEDMLKFLEACIANELDFISISKQPLFQINDELKMGMGWIIDSNSINNQTAIWHNGQTGGFNSYIAFFPNKSTGVFVIANTNVNIQPLGEEILSLTLLDEN